MLPLSSGGLFEMQYTEIKSFIMKRDRQYYSAVISNPSKEFSLSKEVISKFSFILTK